MNAEHTYTELEYYEEIMQFYEDFISSPNQTEIDNWLDSKYIKILSDLKCKKPIADAPIEDVAKNAILLILNLFISNNIRFRSVSWQSLPIEERNLVQNSLYKVLKS